MVAGGKRTKMTGAQRRTRASNKPASVATVNRMINRKIEVKARGFNQNLTASLTGTSALITTLDQGALNSQRIGSEVRMVSIEGWAEFQVNDGTNIIRLVIARFKENTDSASLTFANLFHDSTQSYTSPFNWDKRKEYEVLYDSGPIAGVLSGDSATFIRKIKIKKQHEIHFNPNAATAYGHVFAFAMSDSFASSHPSIDLNLLFKYRDA